MAPCGRESTLVWGKGLLHRYFRLTLHPSKFKSGEFEDFKSLLEHLLPDFNYVKLYHTGMVNYLELAADCLSQTHHSFLPYCVFRRNVTADSEKV